MDLACFLLGLSDCDLFAVLVNFRSEFEQHISPMPVTSRNNLCALLGISKRVLVLSNKKHDVYVQSEELAIRFLLPTSVLSIKVQP